MAQIDVVYDYLKENYNLNEPIFLSEINIPDMKASSLRQQLKKLTEDGRIKRFDTGIYFLPKESKFRSGSSISIDEVIKKKYLMDGGKKCGYISGIKFANNIGLTTQVPAVYEIYTNKATTDYREIQLANIRVIIRKPYVEIDDRNVDVLQFLDLIKEVVEISELENKDLAKRLLQYMKSMGLKFDSLRPYLTYYPDRIYKNLFEVGLLDGISA